MRRIFRARAVRRGVGLCILLIGLAASAGLIQSCSVNPVTGEQSFTAFMSPDEERRVGAEEHPKLVEAFGGEYKDLELERYVTSIGRLLQSTSEQPTPPYKFTVLDSPIVNAFALPGGYVHVSRGLMALANDEAELAGVIAHEIGHVTARHSAERYSRGMVAALGAAILGAAVGSDLAANAAQLGAGIYIQGYSRDQEFQADQLGVRYLARAGFDPTAMSTFLATMAEQDKLARRIAGKEGVEPTASLFSSHPRTADRVQRAAADARAKIGAGAARDSEVYLKKIDGMIYGDSPDQGFIRGREFDHPILKFRFTAPPGFRLSNSAQAVAGEHRNGALLVFDADKPESASMSAISYMTRQWAPSLGLRDAESINVNGMEAATGSDRINTNRGPLDIRLVAIRYAPDRMFRFLFASPPNQTAGLNEPFRRTTYSFRRLSDAEAAALKPLRLRVVRVEPGNTPQSFANRMAFDDFRLERFQVLNGLAPGAPLTAGRLVKIVTE